MREALTIYSAADPPNELQIAIMRNGLAEVISASGKYKEADRLLSMALPVLEKNPKAWGQTAIATNNLGVARFFQGSNDDALRLLLRALAIVEQQMGPDHPMLVRTLNNLASLAARTGHREEAGERLRRALDIAERRLGPEHPVYAARPRQLCGVPARRRRQVPGESTRGAIQRDPEGQQPAQWDWSGHRHSLAPAEVATQMCDHAMIPSRRVFP